MWKRALAMIALANGIIEIIGVCGVLSENIGRNIWWRGCLLSLTKVARTRARREQPRKLCIMPIQTVQVLLETRRWQIILYLVYGGFKLPSSALLLDIISFEGEKLLNLELRGERGEEREMKAYGVNIVTSKLLPQTLKKLIHFL
jgi:hypothetical protein